MKRKMGIFDAENKNVFSIRVSPNHPLNPSLVRQTETGRMHLARGRSPMHLVIHSSCNASPPPTAHWDAFLHCEQLHFLLLHPVLHRFGNASASNGTVILQQKLRKKKKHKLGNFPKQTHHNTIQKIQNCSQNK